MVCSPGGAEGEDMGQMGRTRMEEQNLTAKLVAVMIKKKVAICKRRKWRGGEGREMRERCIEGRREKTQ